MGSLLGSVCVDFQSGEFHFFGCTTNWKEDPWILGGCWGCFGHVKPINVSEFESMRWEFERVIFAYVNPLNRCWIQVAHLGADFPHSPNCFLVEKCFLHIHHVHFVVVGILVMAWKSKSKEPSVDWMTACLMYWLAWLSKSKDPSLLLACFLNNMWNPTVYWLDYEHMVLAMCELVIP